MSLLKFTPHMLKNQPDQTAYLLNKLVSEGVSTGGEGGKLYPGTGQHTDGAMTQKATTDALSLKANSNDVNAALAGKVDKVAGKGLSSNDFTDEELAKLNGIEDGAQVNVQSDWDQTNTSADDYIKNKPTIPTVPTKTSDLINDGSDGTSVYVEADGLATVATSGSYNDLSDQPTIPGPYTLPPATTSTLGGIKVGNNLSVTSDGTLSATAQPAVLYPGLGQNTDGAMTQKASTDLFNEAAYIGTGSVGTLSPWVDTSDLVDGAVTTAKIANGAVTSDNIDFTTMEHWELSTTSNTTITQTTAYSYVDVPGTSITFDATVSGIYLIICTGAVNCVTSSSDCYIRVKANGSTICSGIGQTYGTNRYVGITTMKIWTATQASNSINLAIGGGVSNADYALISGTTIEIIRIG